MKIIPAYITFFTMMSLLSFTSLCVGEEGTIHPHPVDVTIPDDMDVPENFPLGENRTLLCDTCHGVRGLENIRKAKLDSDSKDFLRGGPYEDLKEFCYRCHIKRYYRKRPFHRMIGKDGRIIKERCIYCHVDVPEPRSAHTTRDVRFRLPPEKLCIGCHLLSPHFNSMNHLVEPSESVRKAIKGSERKYNVKLPLDSQGRIMCATCHTPHQKGVLKPDNPSATQVADTDIEEGIVYVESPWNSIFMDDKGKRFKEFSSNTGISLNIEYKEVKKEVLLRLPAKDGTLCTACHTFRE